MANSFAEAFFFNRQWEAHEFQKEAWKKISEGESGLLNAPTGYGKTYAIWFGILHHYYHQREKSRKKRLHALWITPLRALSKEIHLAAGRVSEELELDYRVELRTGDTSAGARQKQRTNTPEALITTPESVHLLLASKGYPDFFGELDFIVVDEWHELMGSKRGVLIELALSRLKQLNPRLKIWGISATIGNLEAALHILLGNDRKGVLVRADLQKEIRIETLLPATLEKFPWAGHLGIRMVDQVIPVIDAHQSTLLFTNTRSQAEIWYHSLLQKHPALAGQMALHHGSLGEDVRMWVEENLHAGRLKAVVCTSSLDLGVDFRPVDCVVQIGSPKGIARFMQRAGRSGHQPGAVSKIYFLPTHSLEILEGASLRFAAAHKMYEQRQPYIRSFDVLIQYLVTLAVSEGFRPADVFREIKTTHCFESISGEEFQECLLMITQGGKSLQAYDEFHKVVAEEGVYRVVDRRTAMRHRLSIGAIVSESMMQVKFRKGGTLGSMEENFISKLKPGQAFWFSGRLLELERVNGMQAIVKLSAKKKGIVPSWMGGRFAITTDFATALRHTFELVKQPERRWPVELKFLRPLFDEQRRVSAIPEENELLVEYIQTQYGYHLFVYPFEGKLIHEGMAAVTAFRLSRTRQTSFSIASNEYGYELLSDSPIDITTEMEAGLFGRTGLSEDIRSGINVSEMARRRFRDIAGIAGLVFQGYPGKPVKTRHLQANSGLFFKVFENYDPNNLLLKEAYDEVFQFQLEYARLYQVYERISAHRVVLQQPETLTPFSFPIFAESFRERYSNEDWEARLEKIKAEIGRRRAAG